MRAFKFLCVSCKRTQRDKPGHTICERCKLDDANLGKLADLIRRAFPRQEWAPTPLIMARVWLAYLKGAQHQNTVAIAEAQQLVATLQRGEQLQLTR